MGEAKRRKQIFFENNPRCCFCSGDAIATTEDHQPARIFFRNKAWPEGFVFPACEPCNQASRDSENLLSILVADSSEGSSRRGYQARVASIRSNYPAVIPSLFNISANDKRRALKHMFVKLQPGETFAELPMVKLDPDFWLHHFQLVGLKIMLGLHYQTFGQPLSRGGRVWLDVKTNGENFQEEWFQTARDMTSRLVFPTRSRKSLLDQFTLQWEAMEGHMIAMYLVTLQKRIVFTGLTTEEPHLHVFPDDRKVFEPLAPDNAD